MLSRVVVEVHLYDVAAHRVSYPQTLPLIVVIGMISGGLILFEAKDDISFHSIGFLMVRAPRVVHEAGESSSSRASRSEHYSQKPRMLWLLLCVDSAHFRFVSSDLSDRC